MLVKAWRYYNVHPDDDYRLGKPSKSHGYLLSCLKANIEALGLNESSKILDLGCGNGFVARQVANWGYDVIGVDPHPGAIEVAQGNSSGIKFELGDSSYENLTKDSFDLIHSLEVIEHVFDPYRFLSDCYELLRSDGWLLLSTPFHGYWKNLALSLTGKMDNHFTALVNNGHIKFFSIPTIKEILEKESFMVKKIERLGRVPVLAKSMMVLAQKKKLTKRLIYFLSDSININLKCLRY